MMIDMIDMSHCQGEVQGEAWAKKHVHFGQTHFKGPISDADLKKKNVNKYKTQLYSFLRFSLQNLKTAQRLVQSLK